jgi:hypothetical protein
MATMCSIINWEALDLLGSLSFVLICEGSKWLCKLRARFG